MSEVFAEETVVGERGPDLGSARLSASAVLLAVLIAVIWGTNPTALKFALLSLPPMGAVGARFVIASVGVWVWCRATGVQVRPQRGEALWLVAAAAFFIVQISTFTLGVYWGTAGHSIVLLHTYPFFVVIMAHFLIPGDRATPGRVVGAIAAFVGVVALFVGEWGTWEGTQLRGDLIQLLSAFLLGAQVVFLKHAVSRIDPSRLVLWEMAIGAAAFFAYSLLFENLASAQPEFISVAAVVYQGIMIGALCFTVWTWLLRRHAASLISIFGFVSPLVGVFVSALALGEPVTLGLTVAAALVAGGIVVANLW
jgi:drug/metabolite transporter (DMT)-like permease